MRYFITFIIIIFISGCGIISPKPPIDASTLQQPDKEKAILYTMRLNQLLGAADPAHVIIDGKEITTLWNGAYITTPLTEGKHYILIKWLLLKNEIVLDVKPNSTYFVLTGWYETVSGCPMCVETQTKVISQTEALQELAYSFEVKADQN